MSRKSRRDFKRKSKESEKWYDLYEDWGLIESSIAAQYGIRLRAEPEMTWDEFTTLLSGILPETPLGYIVGIRSENDKEKLKNFTPEQKRIRNTWRSRNIAQNMNPVEAAKTVQEIQNIFKQMFGGGANG